MTKMVALRLGEVNLDPEGIVLGNEVLAPPVGRNVNETLHQIQASQRVRDSKASKATPSGCRSGKKTLKPGINLAGKVWEEGETDVAFD